FPKPGSRTRTFRPTSRAWRRFSSSWSMEAPSERTRDRRHLPLRDGALEAHAVAEPDHAGNHHRALFRRVRIGAGKPDELDGGRQLRCLHRAVSDTSVGVHAVDLQRQLRHLFSEVYGYDL